MYTYRFVKNIIALFLLIFLGSCVAAVPLVQVAGYAYSGFSLVKTVHFTTGGSMDVGVTEAPPIAPADKKRLDSLKTLAVSNSDPVGISIAEKLCKHFQVITPYKFKKDGLEKIREEISEYQTTSEKTDILVRAGKLVLADGVFHVTTTKGKFEQNWWTLKRPEQASDITVCLISPTQKRVIWKKGFKLVMKIGTSPPSIEEVNEAIASSIVEKFFEDVQVQT
ncbi:MAG: hypothetical protein AB1711_12185 [Thermodesulfobacteriota bacterium]